MKKLRYSTDTFFISVTKYNKEETINEEVEVNVYIRFFTPQTVAFGVTDCIDNNADEALRLVADVIKYTKNISFSLVLELLIFYASKFDILDVSVGDDYISFYNIETKITKVYNLRVWRCMECI